MGHVSCLKFLINLEQLALLILMTTLWLDVATRQRNKTVWDDLSDVVPYSWKFREIQFSWKGNLQRFCGLIFMDGRSRTCTVIRTSRKTGEKLSKRRVVAEMTQESHMIEAIVHGYQGSLVCCCWRRAILHERSGELSIAIRSL